MILFTDLSSDRVVRALSKKGFKIVGNKKHITMSDGNYFATIPRHKRINPYTLKPILKGIGVSDQEFQDLL